MTTTVPSMERITDTLDGLNVSDKLLAFTKYSILVPELREHALSYAKLKDLQAYSQCSKLCNSEVQQYNTEAPSRLSVEERGDSIVVVLFYYKQGYVEKNFPNTDTMKDVYYYVRKMHRHVKGDKIKTIKLDTKKWPSRLMQFDRLANAEFLEVVLYRSLWDDFQLFTQTTNKRFRLLTLSCCDKAQDQVVVPSGFFKSDFTRAIKLLNIKPKITIDKDDFVNSSLEYLCIHNWIDIDFIQGKFLKLIETNTIESFKLSINLPETETRLFDFDELLPAELFGRKRTYSMGVILGATIYAEMSNDRKRISIWYK